MKTIYALLIILIFSIFGTCFAQSVIVKETTDWTAVPVDVDSGASTYTVVGTVPTTTTNYYYTYSGYRCFATKRTVVGADAVVYHAGVSGGTDIYCYPE